MFFFIALAPDQLKENFSDDSKGTGGSCLTGVSLSAMLPSTNY